MADLKKPCSHPKHLAGCPACEWASRAHKCNEAEAEADELEEQTKRLLPEAKSIVAKPIHERTVDELYLVEKYNEAQDARSDALDRMDEWGDAANAVGKFVKELKANGDAAVWDRLVAEHNAKADEAEKKRLEGRNSIQQLQFVDASSTDAEIAASSSFVLADQTKIPASGDWALNMRRGFQLALQYSKKEKWTPSKAVGPRTGPAHMSISSTWGLLGPPDLPNATDEEDIAKPLANVKSEADVQRTRNPKYGGNSPLDEAKRSALLNDCDAFKLNAARQIREYGLRSESLTALPVAKEKDSEEARWETVEKKFREGNAQENAEKAQAAKKASAPAPRGASDIKESAGNDEQYEQYMQAWRDQDEKRICDYVEKLREWAHHETRLQDKDKLPKNAKYRTPWDLEEGDDYPWEDEDRDEES